MIRIFQFLLIGAAVAWLCACANNGYSVSGLQDPQAATQGMTAGNWVITVTSNQGNGTGGSNFLPVVLTWEGPVTTSNNAVSMAAYLSNYDWNDKSCGGSWPSSNSTITGNLNGNNITLSFALTKYTSIAITGTLSSETNLSGTFQASTTNPACSQVSAFSGTVSGAYIAPITGNWQGTLTETKEDLTGVVLQSNIADVAAAITQASSPVTVNQGADGPASGYPLSGTVAFAGALCYESGQVDPTQSYIAGEMVRIVVLAPDNISYDFPETPSSLDPTQQSVLNFNTGSPTAASTFQVYTPLCPNDGNYLNVEQVQLSNLLPVLYW